MIQSRLVINVHSLENEGEDYENTSNIVECELTVQSNFLKDETIIIGNDLLSDSLCLKQQQQQPQLQDNNEDDNNTKISPSIWCKLPFSSNNNSLHPLPIRCEDCDDKFFMFRNSELKFSASGKCSVPIVFKLHDDIPLNTELFLRIEIFFNNHNILLVGQTMVPFRRTSNNNDDEDSSHVYSLLSEKEKEKEIQRLLQTAVLQLQRVMDGIDSNPTQSPQLTSLKRKAGLLLNEVSNHIPEKTQGIKKRSKSE